MSLKNVYRYFVVKLSPVGRLPTELVPDYDITAADPDDLLVMMTMKARSPAAVQRLKDKYGVKTAAELLPLLPKRKPPPIRERIRVWLMTLEGARPGNPIAREIRREKQRQNDWMHQSFNEVRTGKFTDPVVCISTKTYGETE